MGPRIVLALALASLPGCSPRRGFEEYALRRPEPVRLACTEPLDLAGARIPDARDERVLWRTRILGRHGVRPLYVTSRSVEEALDGAYCRALEALVEALGSEDLRDALR